MRYIDADALKEQIQFRLPIDNKNAEVISGCVDITRRIIDNAPTADVVEVVRCKACKHWKEAYKNCKYGGCEVYEDCGSYPADWYCADGERRNDVEQG